MNFKVTVPSGHQWHGQATFWWDKKLHYDNKEAMTYFKIMLDWHIPKVVAFPGLIDYSNDLTNGAHMYRALLDIFKDRKVKVLVKPSAEFMGTNYPPGTLF